MVNNITVIILACDQTAKETARNTLAHELSSALFFAPVVVYKAALESAAIPTPCAFEFLRLSLQCGAKLILREKVVGIG